MENLLFLLLDNGVEFIKLYIIVCGVLNKKTFKTTKLLLVILLSNIGLCILYITNISTPSYLEIVNSFICIIIIGSFISGTHRYLNTILCYLLINMLDMMNATILNCIINKPFGTLADNNVVNLSINAISIAVLIIITIFKRRINYHVNIEKIWGRTFIMGEKVFLIVSLLLDIIIVQLLWSYEDSSQGNILLISFIIIIAGIYCFIVGGLLLNNIDRGREYKRLSTMNQELLEQQHQYYESIMNNEAMTRKFRHDYNNHMVAISYLLKLKKYDEVEDYLNSLLNVNDIIMKRHVHTGNTLLDYIVFNLFHGEKASNCKLQWEGKLPKEIMLNNMEVCTIFCNLLENAIESTNKIIELEKKEIKVVIKTRMIGVLITISNPIEDEVKIENKKLISSKRDKKLHGYGFDNAKECIERSGGSIRHWGEDGEFTVLIKLNIKNE